MSDMASRPAGTGGRRLIGMLAYPAAALLSYLCYWFVAGAILDGLTSAAIATLKGDPLHVVADLLFAVCGLLGGLLAGAVAALFWPARRAALIAVLLGSLLAWEEMARPLGYLLVLRTPPVVAEIVSFLSGAAVSHRLTSRRLARRRMA